MELVPRLQYSIKVCVGVVVGSVVGNIFKSLLALTAVIVFVWTTWKTVPDLKVSNIDLPLPQIEWPVINPKAS